MTRRATMLLVLLLLGAVAGFAASWALGTNPRGDGVAAPVPAASPSLPLDPVPGLLADPQTDPLPESLPVEEITLGEGDARLRVGSPRGWSVSEIAPGEWRWRAPDHTTFGYQLRMRYLPTARRSIDWTIDRRPIDLRSQVTGLQVLGETASGLHLSYITGNHLRFAHLAWADVSGSDRAQVEISVVGRRVDDPGMAELVARILAGVRRA